ncbi:MAG: hypothetical protein H6622_09145 [Halobacteriovoraceae bacterium]|nr:hypothetical protein [Halobacteriovoraceae bacterium]
MKKRVSNTRWFQQLTPLILTVVFLAPTNIFGSSSSAALKTFIRHIEHFDDSDCERVLVEKSTNSFDDHLSHYEEGIKDRPPSHLYEQHKLKGYMFIINSSNSGKKQQFDEMFGPLVHGFLEIDKREIDSDPLSVAVHKASQFKDYEHPVLIDDTIMEIDGEEVGINIRWIVESGKIKDYVGKRATWGSTLAYRIGNKVYTAYGEIHGTIVDPFPLLNTFHPDIQDLIQQGAFGFDLFFKADGDHYPIGFNKVPKRSPRWHAAKKILRGEVEVHDTIEEWSGPWQND